MEVNQLQASWEMFLDTHWIRGRIGPSDGQIVVVKKRTPIRDGNGTLTIQTLDICLTDWDILFVLSLLTMIMEMRRNVIPRQM
jgi:hypothetical protein